MTENIDSNSTMSNDNSEDDSENLVLSQQQVNKIVKDRLARQRKEHENLVNQISSEVEGKDNELKEYEEFFNTYLEQQMVDVPEPVKELLDKLSLSEKMAWLKKNGKSESLKGFEKQQIPNTPKGSEKDNSFKPNTKNVFKM